MNSNIINLRTVGFEVRVIGCHGSIFNFIWNGSQANRSMQSVGLMILHYTTFFITKNYKLLYKLYTQPANHLKAIADGDKLNQCQELAEGT